MKKWAEKNEAREGGNPCGDDELSQGCEGIGMGRKRHEWPEGSHMTERST